MLESEAHTFPIDHFCRWCVLFVRSFIYGFHGQHVRNKTHILFTYSNAKRFANNKQQKKRKSRFYLAIKIKMIVKYIQAIRITIVVCNSMLEVLPVLASCYPELFRFPSVALWLAVR